jgi:hypothetical protein
MKNLVVAVGLGLAAIGTVCAAETTPPFKVTCKRSDDRVEVKTEKDCTVFSIRSPFGISNAIIERTGESWPDKARIHLRLKGLENFKLSNGDQTLEASVSSQDGKVRLWKDDDENSPLDSKSPYWMEIRMLDRDGKQTKAIPITDGYFEVQLPKAFFEGNPKSITLHWIDFYRH